MPQFQADFPARVQYLPVNQLHRHGLIIELFDRLAISRPTDLCPSWPAQPAIGGQSEFIGPI